MKRLILLFLFLILTMSGIAQWEWQNPRPQGNNLLDIVSINENIGYACGRYGTFIKITSAGLYWNVLTFPKKMDLQRLHFINEMTGWVTCTNDSSVALFKTMDSGVNWVNQFEAEAGYISASFVNGNQGWLSVDSTIYHTTDGGNNWVQQTTLGEISDVLFINETHGWALCGFSASGGVKVFYTSDGGNSWEVANLILDIASKIIFINEDVGWVIGTIFGLNESTAYVLKTNDGGSTWEQQLTYNSYYIDFTDIDFINENIGWANRRGLIFKTTNGGLNWEELPYTRYLYQIAAVSEQLIWGCGYYGVSYISFDGGMLWQKNYEGELLSGAQELFVLNENICFVGGSNALLKTTDRGNNWGKIDLNIPGQTYFDIISIWFKDALTGWMGLDIGGLFKTTDGGYNWTNQVNNVDYISDIYFIDSSMGWFVSRNQIYHTIDGGETWFIQSEQSEIDQLYRILFTSPYDGWTGGYIGLLKTTDGGNTWSQVNPLGLTPNTRSIHFINQLEGWILNVSNSMNILKTSDGGLNWENQLDPPLTDFSPGDIYFTDSDNGWIVGWREFYNPPAVILHTSNGGSDWNAIDFPSSHYLYNIGFANKNIGWILGTNGTILHTTNGGFTFVGQYQNNEIPNNYSLFQNYPNPFNPVTSIQYAISSRQLVTLKVYDILGREITTLVNEEKPAGEYEVEFNGTNLPSRIYFYQLKAGEYRETRKMVLVK